MNARTITIGVSFKLYLDVASTLTWIERAAEFSGSSKPVIDRRVRLFVLPSFPVLPLALHCTRETPIAIGAQDLHTQDRGPFTGEVSGADLAALGCRFVEVGHAERRRLFSEDENVVAEKMLAAARNDLTPVLCIGEPDQGPATEAADECVRQLDSALALCGNQLDDLVVAYEPQWAIGAQHPAPVEHIAAVCRQLRVSLATAHDSIKSAVIYGGSAKAGLLTELRENVDGLFLGRFAHDPAVLQSILAEAENILDAA